MEIILPIIIIALAVYFNKKINKMTILVAHLSDKQTEVVVNFFVSKLQEKGVLTDNEIESLYQDINLKIKNEVNADIFK